jgi:hypothetical protein
MNGGTVYGEFPHRPTGLPRTYTIANYTTKSGNVANLTANSRASVTLGDTGTTITATVNSYTQGNLTWNGSGAGTWDLSTTANWKNASGAADTFFQLDNTAFTDLPGAVTTANLTTFVAPASIVANAGTTNYTITGSGTIGGAGGITKSGASILHR